MALSWRASGAPQALFISLFRVLHLEDLPRTYPIMAALRQRIPFTFTKEDDASEDTHILDEQGKDCTHMRKYIPY